VATLARAEWLVVVALLAVGAGSVTFLARANATVQLEARPEMRGRVMALWSVAFIGSTPIGGPIIGAVSEHASPRWGLFTQGSAALAAAAFGGLWLWRNGLARARPSASRPTGVGQADDAAAS
jgi:MFS family permease